MSSTAQPRKIKRVHAAATEEQIQFVMDNHSFYNTSELRQKTGLSINELWNIYRTKGIRPKVHPEDKKYTSRWAVLWNKRKLPSYNIERVPAVYTNSKSPYGIYDELCGIKII